MKWECKCIWSICKSRGYIQHYHLEFLGFNFYFYDLIGKFRFKQLDFTLIFSKHFDLQSLQNGQKKHITLPIFNFYCGSTFPSQFSRTFSWVLYFNDFLTTENYICAPLVLWVHESTFNRSFCRFMTSSKWKNDDPFNWVQVQTIRLKFFFWV